MIDIMENLRTTPNLKVLAKKGTLYFLKYEKIGSYSIERITQGFGGSLFWSKDKFDAIDFFVEACKKQRKGDFNLEFYGIK